MKKDHIRDYATEAFRYYARNKGKVPDGASDAAAADVIEVEKVMCELQDRNEPYAADVLKAVYFLHPQYPLRRRDISMRVINAAFSFQTNERKVYYILAEARRLFAAFRGLREN